jgi:hypothetical protein
MQSSIKTWATGVALLMSSAATMAAAPSNTGCAVLLPSAINAGQPYTVKVVRVPSYPGGWFSPTISVDVSYPTTSKNVISDSRTQTIKNFSVTYVLATFTVPDAFNALNEAVITSGGSANVTATVLEPINKKKPRETTCTASVTVY